MFFVEFGMRKKKTQEKGEKVEIILSKNLCQLE